jgi:nitrogen fixation protein NifQ
VKLQLSAHGGYVLNQSVRERLLAHAEKPDDLRIVAFAGIIAVLWRDEAANPVPILGLNSQTFKRLASRCFGAAGEALAASVAPGASHPARDRLREFNDILRLLLEHRAALSEETQWLACAIATACLGENHLWQDLGLPSRSALSRLLVEHFGPLASKNVAGMRWKKFFYKQLCLRADINICKAPSCSECVDYDLCFGPEDAACPSTSTLAVGISGWCAAPG